MSQARLLAVGLVSMVALLLVSCAEKPMGRPEEEILVSFSADDFSGVVAESHVYPDPLESSDGGGSLRVTVSRPASVTLYELGDLDVEDATLVYRAKMRPAGIQGRAYLEMWCEFEEHGEFFSRGFDDAVRGTAEDWTVCGTPFKLQAGQNPTNVRLGLVVDGRGTVWIDEIELVRLPLE